MFLKQIFLVVTLVGMLLIFCTDAWSEPMPEPQLLSTSIQKADLVVLTRLEQFTPDKTDANNTLLSESQKVVSYLALHPAGSYDFHVMKVLKGNYSDPNDFRVPLPIISLYYYDYKFDLPAGCQVLLLLKRENNQLVPVDETIPLIPLGSGQVSTSIPKLNGSFDVEHLVVSIMTSTLEDPSLRKVNMHLLRSVEDSQLPAKLTPLEKDADENFRDDVLYCSIINQQVQAIPLMAQLAELRLKETGGAASVGAFEHLKTKAAVPYLNPLLLNVSPFTRQATAFALRGLADRTSLPYLFKALEQPDTQGITLYEEYATLHRLLSRLGTTKSLPAFLDQREATLTATRLWWTKHQQEFMPEATSAPSKT